MKTIHRIELQIGDPADDTWEIVEEFKEAQDADDAMVTLRKSGTYRKSSYTTKPKEES